MRRQKKMPEKPFELLLLVPTLQQYIAICAGATTRFLNEIAVVNAELQKKSPGTAGLHPELLQFVQSSFVGTLVGPLLTVNDWLPSVVSVTGA